jgi:hypothetical protein
MRNKLLFPILLVIILAAGIGVYVYQKNTPDKEEYMASARAYLEEQKTAMAEAKAIPIDVDPQTGRFISVRAVSPDTVDRVISYIIKATEVRRVKAIPELSYPHVYVGDRINGNNEKLYYSEDNKVFEFSLSKTDSLGFLLYLGGAGTTYPEVKEAFSEGVIRQLRNEIVWGNKDVLTFSNGYLEAIDIKTQATAEMLFQCIRNCVQITDLTDANLEPMALPIEINGRGTGTFDTFFTAYEETGQFISISFSPEDSERFYDYVTSLQQKEY